MKKHHLPRLHTHLFLLVTLPELTHLNWDALGTQRVIGPNKGSKFCICSSKLIAAFNVFDWTAGFSAYPENVVSLATNMHRGCQLVCQPISLSVCMSHREARAVLYEHDCLTYRGLLLTKLSLVFNATLSVAIQVTSVTFLSLLILKNLLMEKPPTISGRWHM